ncbi:MAG: hypothetical protein WBL02_05805, partial [Methanomethylovorans sp.]
NLHKSGLDVEILTTCVKQFLSDWNTDHFAEGIYKENGITVRRFNVYMKDAEKFDFSIIMKLKNILIILDKSYKKYSIA